MILRSDPTTAVGNDVVSTLELVDAQYQLAATCEIHQIVLDFPPALGISAACASIFGRVDRDDMLQKRIARNAWLLKTTVLQTMLPFDDLRLQLEPTVKAIEEAVDAVPAIAEPTRVLGRLVAAMLEAPRNPKQEKLIELANLSSDQFGGLAIVTGLQCGATPGWPVTTVPSDVLNQRALRFVRARRDIRGQVFSQIVVPGTTRFASRFLVHEVLYGGRAANIVILSYRGERIDLPPPLIFPSDTIFTASRKRGQLRIESNEGVLDTGLDHWANESFWQGIRASHAEVAPLSERDVRVNARFVLFEDGSGAFLPEDGSVIELSGLLDGGAFGIPDISEDRLPRKAVHELEERDVVLLRLSGSGNYLDDVADAMMEKEGFPSLRADATAWKWWLHRVIKGHGEGTVARVAREIGVPLRSASYLWVWAGDAVMAPRDFPTFRLLVNALTQLDNSSRALDAGAYAAEKWKQMEHVKGFQLRAGAAIRVALLKEVRRLVAEGGTVEKVEVIELPDVEAGRMGLLRIAAVDSKSMQLPLSRLFHISSVKGD